MVHDGRKLPGATGGGEYSLAHLRRRCLSGREPEPRRGRRHPAHLVGALLAAAHVVLEPAALGFVIDGVDRVNAGQDVQVRTEQPHHVTPMQSRSLIRPSRILVLMVPSVMPSSSATWR